MIYKTLSYGRTRSLGNYQSERLDISVDLEEDDDPVLVFQQLKTLVLEQLYPPEESQSESL